MLGLDFSLSLKSVKRLVEIMQKHNVSMLSTSFGELSIWDEDKKSQISDRDYNMKDILDNKNVRDILVSKGPHQLADLIEAILEATEELTQKES